MAATVLGNARGSAAIVATNEANQLKSGTGLLKRIIVNNVGTLATIDIYDHATTTTNKIFEWVSADGKVVRDLMIPFQNGLRVVTGGTFGNAVVVWE